MAMNCGSLPREHFGFAIFFLITGLHTNQKSATVLLMCLSKNKNETGLKFSTKERVNTKLSRLIL